MMTSRPIRYTYRWGFVHRVRDEDYWKEWTYVYRWGFVWRRLRSNHDPYTIAGWTNYRIHQTAQMSRWRPGQIIDVNDCLDYVSLATEPSFIRKKGLTTI
jgi:hypothetical protein